MNQSKRYALFLQGRAQFSRGVQFFYFHPPSVFFLDQRSVIVADGNDSFQRCIQYPFGFLGCATASNKSDEAEKYVAKIRIMCREDVMQYFWCHFWYTVASMVSYYTLAATRHKLLT